MPVDDLEEARRWLTGACERAGISATELARRADIAPSTLTRFLKPGYGGGMLTGRTLQKLATALSHAASPPSASRGRAPVDARLLEARNDFRAAPVPIPFFNLRLAPSDIGAPAGAEELEMFWGGPAAQERCGDAYSDRAVGPVFAVYMPGEFMRPRFRTGEYLIIDRLRPASITSEVFVEFASPADEPIGTIAELVDRDRSQIKLQQLQHSTLATIHRSLIRNIYPVIGAFRSDIAGSGLHLDVRPRL